MTRNSLKSRVMEVHLSSLVWRTTTQIPGQSSWIDTDHTHMPWLISGWGCYEVPCAQLRTHVGLSHPSKHTDLTRKFGTLYINLRYAEGSCFQTGKHPHHKYLVNDACVVTTATHTYRLVMTGHINLIWSLAKNSADGTSQRSDLNNTSDLPAVCTEPEIEIRGGCDSRGRAGHSLIGKSVVRSPDPQATHRGILWQDTEP